MPAMKRPPYTILLPTIYGDMLVNRHDVNQTEALVKFGVALSHIEMEFLAGILRILGLGAVFADVGANYGTFALRLAREVGPEGRVYAFEPQRVIFNMLAGTVALNGLDNVRCYHSAVGAVVGEVELPQFDYNQPLNFGSVEFGPRQTENLSQTRGDDPQRREFVPITTLDRFAFPRLDLLKVDTEGMEVDVLTGGRETIRRYRPTMYVEWLKADRALLETTIRELDYAIFPMGDDLFCVPVEQRARFAGIIPP